MKLKNIILTMAIVFAGGFVTSCNTEMPSEPVPTPEAATVSFILTTGGVETKVGDYTGSDGTDYTKATEEELQINDVFIAIFDENGQLVDGVYRSFDTHPEPVDNESPNSNNLTREYTITGIQLTPGAYEFLAIANSTLTYLSNGEPLYDTYTEYQDLIEKNLQGGQHTAIFEPSKLVKVSELFPKTISATETAPIRIPLLQLAAKFELSFTVDAKREAYGEPYHENFKYSPKDVHEWLNTEKNAPPEAGFEECNDKIQSHGITEYMGVAISWQGNGQKGYHITNEFDHIQPYAEWVYDVKELTIFNIETETSVVLDAINEESDYLRSITLNENLDGVITFYSYEKDFKTENPITVQVKGDLNKKVVLEVTRKQGKFILAWLKKNDSGDPILSGGKYQLESGWGNEGSVVFLDIPNEVFETISDPVIIQTPLQKHENVILSSIINPVDDGEFCFTDGVIHGNIYTINALISIDKAINQEIKTSWVVNSWNIMGTEITFH